MLDLVLVSLFQIVSGAVEAPAQALPSTQQPVAENQQVQPAGPRERCRRENITGTRLSRTVCTTESQDDQIEAESREQIHRMQMNMGLQGGG